MSKTIRFTVYGRPQQVGSKIPQPVYGRNKQPVMSKGRVVCNIRDDNKKAPLWMAQVTEAARRVYQGDLISSPCLLSVDFFFARPKSHYGTGRNAGKRKPSAPRYHAQTPDLAKLMRAIEDGITGIIWHDDKQVIGYGDPRRHWTTRQERAEVRIEFLE